MYPIWEVPVISGGLILALIATFHILPSHLSVGAMWFNIYIETEAYRKNKPELMEFIKKYSLLLLIFSYVFGSITGIGIWFSATVINPRGISALIHNYVWGWATEWCFFIIELVGIIVYYYTLSKVSRKTHLRIGWIFAISSYITMIIIVGILSFMLTPGKWPQTGNFFDGFFNQSYWLQLFTRTAFMFVISSGYALAAASRLKDEQTKHFISRAASVWGLTGLSIGSILLLLYMKVLPQDVHNVSSVLIGREVTAAALAVFILLTMYFVLTFAKPSTVRLVPAILAILVVFIGIWSLERARETVRKPYIIAGYMYSNQVIGSTIPSKGVDSEVQRMKDAGILKTSPFIPASMSEITDQNRLDVGHMIALMQCSSCHVMNKKGLRPLPGMLARMGLKEAGGISTFLDGIGYYPYMPPFIGNDAEKQALSAYLVALNQ